MVFAARMEPPLRRALERSDRPGRPIAETWRRVGAEADRLGLTRPSYERVRQLVHEFRARTAAAASAAVVVEIALRIRIERGARLARARRSRRVTPWRTAWQRWALRANGAKLAPRPRLRR